VPARTPSKTKMTPSSFAAVITVALLVFASGVHGQDVPAKGSPAFVALGINNAVAKFPAETFDASTLAQVKTFTDCLTKVGGKADVDITDACSCWGDDGEGQGKKAMASINATFGKLGADGKEAAQGFNLMAASFSVCDQPFPVMSSFTAVNKCVGSNMTANKKACECYTAQAGNTMYFDWYQKSGLGAADPIYTSCVAFKTWLECMDKAPGGQQVTGKISAAEACKCSATCKSDVGCWTTAKDTMGALSDNLVCAGMAVSPSFLLIAAFAAVLAGRGLFQ